MLKRHIFRRRWKNYGGGKWSPMARMIAKLDVGQAVFLESYPNDHASLCRLRGGIGSTAAGKLLRVSIRSLKGSKGVFIVRQPDWGSDYRRSK